MKAPLLLRVNGELPQKAELELRFHAGAPSLCLVLQSASGPVHGT